MKRAELAFNLVSLPVDAIMLVLAGIASFYVRLRFTDVVGPVLYRLTLTDLLKVGYVVIPALMVIFALLGLYNLKGTRRVLREMGLVGLGVSVGLFLVIVMFFFNQTLFPSRFIILATWGFGIVFVVAGRIILKLLQEALARRGIGLHRLVLINGNNQESRVIYEILRDKKFGYEIIAELGHEDGIIAKLEDLYRKQPFDEVMQANSSLQDGENLKILEFAKSKGLNFSFVPNLFEVQRTAVEIQDFKGVPVISIKNTPLDGWGKVAKRLLDVVASGICLLITSPLFLIIYIAIKLDSPGPVFYVAQRCGKDGDFNFYKFRTMYAHLSVGEKYGSKEAELKLLELLQDQRDEHRGGPLHKIKNDPRVTRFGKFLRKTKLDEIPQFWNVFKGDMSMVGHRPHLPEQVKLYRDQHGRIFTIKPGIFGMTQIAQISWPTLPFEKEIGLDIYYIENWSLWLDIKILAESFYALFFGSKSQEDY